MPPSTPPPGWKSKAPARQVATVTALVPIALADVAAALTANIRMIRRIAEIYGGRSGAVESWRLTRSVLSHPVATGAVAVTDDLLSSVGGGHLLSKVSRRFGEGIVNGALHRPRRHRRNGRLPPAALPRPAPPDRHGHDTKGADRSLSHQGIAPHGFPSLSTSAP